VELHGSLHWRDPGEAERVLRQLEQMNVYVNDHLQAPPQRLPRDPARREQPFVVPLLLNREQNDIQVECPFPLDDDSRRSAHVQCAKPEQPGTLRVLLVNAGEEQITNEVFLGRALAALHVEPGSGSVLHSRAFGQVVVYPHAADRTFPLSLGVTEKRVHYWLDIMGRDIQRDARDRRPSDVVLIYWLGKDLVQDARGEWYLPTGDSAGRAARDPAAGGQPLATLFSPNHQVPGARILLLDTAVPAGTAPTDVDLTAGRAAVLRYVWSRNAVPEPGLLEALTRAGRAQKPVSLREWANTARPLTSDLGKNYQTAVRLTEHLPPSLSNLVVTTPE
jgi:hypothetical protein